jgi:hypothetical protein
MGEELNNLISTGAVNGAATVDSSDNSPSELEKLKEDFNFLKDEFYYLMNRVCRLEEDNRRLKNDWNEDYKWELQNMKFKIDSLYSMYDGCLSKVDNVSKFVDEMSQDYVNKYVVASVD